MSAYGTLAEANAYHLSRGNTLWAGTDEAKDIARLRGSEYVDATYRAQFPGWPTGDRSQLREWPRNWAYDIYHNDIPATEVPREVKESSYEAALRELVTPGSLQPDWNPANQNKREKVDVIEVEVEKMAIYGPTSVLPIVNIIRGIIRPVLTGSSLSMIAGNTARI